MRPEQQAKPTDPKFIDLTGHRYGITTVIEYWCRLPIGRRTLWLCRCDCGNEHIARGNGLRTGDTKSCGCLSNGGRAAEHHGYHHSPTYSTWLAMRDRCYNPNNASAAYYYDLGITICDRWRNSFTAFLKDMGERPDGMTLDRWPDKNGNYEPGNCRWATVLQQNRNLRNTIMVEWDGVMVPLRALVEQFGMDINTVKYRMKNGASPKDALTVPTDKRRRWRVARRSAA